MLRARHALARGPEPEGAPSHVHLPDARAGGAERVRAGAHEQVHLHLVRHHGLPGLRAVPPPAYRRPGGDRNAGEAEELDEQQAAGAGPEAHAGGGVRRGGPHARHGGLPPRLEAHHHKYYQQLQKVPDPAVLGHLQRPGPQLCRQVCARRQPGVCAEGGPVAGRDQAALRGVPAGVGQGGGAEEPHPPCLRQARPDHRVRQAAQGRQAPPHGAPRGRLEVHLHLRRHAV
mmetsp:Transcript_23146/g.50732  ORF Transcript_23146/g.50732 Transcript_23146/m.50732 type:complete len:230 (+) Transcript_23146:609-1298(+)